MPLNLPTPRSPQGLPRHHARAYRRWQTGQGLAQQAQWGAAARAFESASEIALDAPYSLATAHALIKAGREADAEQCAQRLRQRDPRSLLGCTLQAHALLALGRNEEAVRCLQSLPADVARDHEHHKSLALALQRCQRHADAVPVFFAALATQLSDAYLHFHLGMSFKDLGLKAEAAECVRTALALGVGSSELAARGQLWFLEREACRWPQARQAALALQAGLAALPHATPMEANPFTHAVLCDDPLQVLKVARHHALHVQRRAPPSAAHSETKSPNRQSPQQIGADAVPAKRLRVGYLSADFHTHATSQLLVQMLEAHDRQAVAVSLFSTGPDDGSALRRRVEQACEHFINLRGLSPQAMAQRIRQPGVDILVDLKGATYDTLLPVLALRPAPLQVTWLGFPGSTGAPFIDYLIGDPVVTPLAHAAHFSEQIAQLPHCYQPNDSRRDRPAPDPRSDWGLAKGDLALCAFHQSYKISPEVFDTWCGLLHALPQARLWLLQWNTNVEAALRAAAAERGVDADRLQFAPVVPLARHLARLACADLYLDAWPCNAHTTAGEALWMGVPVVTIEGATFAQRVGASLLHNVGLPQLVCADAAAYHAKVVALAGDPKQRRALRDKLDAQRVSSPLFDGQRQARDMEALLQRMWQRHRSGLPPQPLAAEVQP